MECLSPITIKNPKFLIDKREYQYLKVPCGKCEACAVNKQTSWFIRLNEEFKTSSKSYFITLTYNDDHNYGNLSKTDIQLFIKRIREDLRNENLTLKYYLVGEYGPQTLRPHYHCIFFINGHLSFDFDFHNLIENQWHNGFVMISDVNYNRIKYVSGYFISKLWTPENREPCFTLCSKGLGRSYLNDENIKFHQVDFKNKFYYPLFGKKLPLPRYYKEKIFDDQQRSLFSKECEERSNTKYDEALKSFNFDIFKLERYYKDKRADYARYVRKYHKKVKV